ncbi:CST complex subunit CTC1-like isoform X2 [Telopea speciosissima]|uniref:CST complex subunit CTC1-like isoform X2 n=1 Tax=Telopea speciosissima TaxID=54955 RepID=UPI001CC64626|nr:CST complex subunit CTC1-like isoform X2 [Telopea speciosissima]
MEGVRNISISELLQRSRPLTGASSLCSPSISVSRFPPEANCRQRSSDGTATKPDSVNISVSEENSSRRILSPLKYPALIIGTLSLPSSDTESTSNQLSCGLRNSCFVFSDGVSRICCAVLDLDIKIIGKQIHVLAWNFIPFKGGGGFLEIIRWSLSNLSTEICQSSHADAFLLASASHVQKEHFEPRSSVCGRLGSVSPVFVIPCTVKGNVDSGNCSKDSRNLSGFLAEIMVCECYVCTSKASVASIRNLLQGHSSHSFNRPAFLYFYGSASFWHPVLSNLLGIVVLLSAVKKKQIFSGKEEPCLMFTSTDKTVLHIPRSPVGELLSGRNRIKGRGESGVYTGVVTGVYMQGMVVELDEKVWLLLTDHISYLPHSLRLGAIISLRNVHFVHPNFSWSRMLLLGACCKTTINVESFSSVESQCHIRLQSQSLLHKFIGTLAFSARLWVLLTVSCFRKKFAGTLSEKKILGSKYQEGLVQMYARSGLPSSFFRPRHGLFIEFSKHNQSSCGSEPNDGYLKLVVPITNFISHCEAIWLKTLVQMNKDPETIRKRKKFRLLPCEGNSYGRLVRRIISSEDLALVLMGNLEISPSSGRLQLIDATGSIEVVVPDLPSNWDARSIYEVKHYTVVIEGIPAQLSSFSLLRNESFPCRSIFDHVSSMKERNNLAIYVHFHMSNAISLNGRFPCMDWSGNPNLLENGTFRMLLITHKFPAMQNFQGRSNISKSSTLLAEAIILPWDLSLPLENGNTCPTEVSNFKLRKCSQDHVKRNCQDSSNKRPKIVHLLGRALTAGSIDGLEKDENEAHGSLSDCSPCADFSSNQKPCNLKYPLTMLCYVTFGSCNDQNPLRSAILYCTNPNAGDDELVKRSLQKVVLEFKPESLFKYQLLRIGGYYILKYPEKELQCNLRDCGYRSCGKVIITSETQLWSIYFACDEDPFHTKPESSLPSDVSSRTIDANLSEGSLQNELIFQRSARQNPLSCSDVHLHLSADAMKHLKICTAAVEGLISPIMAPAKAVNVSAFIMTNMTVPVPSSGTPDPSSRLPEGDLISLHGNVLAVHSLNCSSLCAQKPLGCETMGDAHQLWFFQGTSDSVCIHILEGRDIVKIRGTLWKHAFPIGLGPGVTATFHRVLVLGPNELLLTPVSFIVIDSVKEVLSQDSDMSSHPISTPDILCDALQDTVPSGFIPELIHCLESGPVQLRCRVVAIRVLVLEMPKSKFEKLQTREQSKDPAVNIPLAGFVLDDGSSTCCLWANAERAAKLLRLQEETSISYFSSSYSTLRTGSNKAPSTTIYDLRKILKKHNRVTVKNQGSMHDPSCQELLFSVTSDKVLSSSDESVIKFIILNACHGAVLNVLGSVMDSDAFGWLEMELAEMEMPVHSIRNIWAREIRYADYLTDAKTVLQELLVR